MEDDEAKELSKYFCQAVNAASGAVMKFEKHGKNVRLIISGPEDFILDALNGWYKNN